MKKSSFFDIEQWFVVARNCWMHYGLSVLWVLHNLGSTRYWCFAILLIFYIYISNHYVHLGFRFSVKWMLLGIMLLLLPQVCCLLPNPFARSILNLIFLCCTGNGLTLPVGHGRSVAVMCALLVALGVVEDWKKAELFIRERRPYISMNSVQYKALEEWSKHWLSTPSIDEVNSSSAVSSTSSGRPRPGRPKNRSG